MGVVARTLINWITTPFNYILEKADALIPNTFIQMISKI
jgi:hypothetical protein